MGQEVGRDGMGWGEEEEGGTGRDGRDWWDAFAGPFCDLPTTCPSIPSVPPVHLFLGSTSYVLYIHGGIYIHLPPLSPSVPAPTACLLSSIFHPAFLSMPWPFLCLPASTSVSTSSSMCLVPAFLPLCGFLWPFPHPPPCQPFSSSSTTILSPTSLFFLPSSPPYTCLCPHLSIALLPSTIAHMPLAAPAFILPASYTTMATCFYKP